MPKVARYQVHTVCYEMTRYILVGARLQVGTARQLPGVPTYKQNCDIVGLIINMVIGPTHGRISLKHIHNMGTSSQKALKALSLAKNVYRISV
jgi:hypothetical protein